MDRLTIYPTQRLHATIQLPASKSISNRALLINALSHSTFVPENVSDCDDTRVMLAALRNMPEVIDIGAAGTAMRFLTAYLAVTPGTHVLTGTERMRHRPIGVLVDALRQLGGQITYAGEEGFPPLCITGNDQLEGGQLTMPGNVSSQYISALLMIGPTLKKGLCLTLTDKIVSRPYLDMTIAMMRDFGAQVEWEGADSIRVSPVPYTPQPYRIENDWSAASYWYEMVALSDDPHAEVLLPGLCYESLQGDARVRDIYNELGVVTEFFRDKEGTNIVRLSKGQNLTCWFSYDFTHQPDLAQTVAVTCAMLEVPFHLYGLQSLRIKETDRIAALETELGHFGLSLEVTESALAWEGLYRSEGDDRPAIATYEDHRMAMAFAPTSLRTGAITILNPQVVSKSYPTFWDDLEKAGFSVCY